MIDVGIHRSEEGRRTGRRMGGPCKLHSHYGGSGRESSCKPSERFEALLGGDKAEELGDANTYNGADEVAADESSGLCEWGLNSPVEEHTRGPLRSLIRDILQEDRRNDEKSRRVTYKGRDNLGNTAVGKVLRVSEASC